MRKPEMFLGMAMLTLGFPMTAFASDGFEDFNDYMTEDGNYAYYFECGINVIMPEDWYRNVLVEADQKFVTFYHQASCDKYLEDGDNAGGKLLTIGCSVNTDFKDYPGYTYIGYDEEEAMNYYYSIPTDYQGYTGDASVKEEYDQLYSELDEVCKSITLDTMEYDDDDAVDVDLDDSEEAAEIARKATEIQPEDKGGMIAGKIGGDETEMKTSAEPEEYTFDESKSDYEGTWVTFADAYQVYLPSYWDYYYLTEQEKQEGILYKAEGEAEDIAVIINYSVIGNGAEEDLLTNEEVAENFRRAGYREVKQVVINGITSVTCSIPDEDISLTAFLNEEGNRLYMVMVNTDEETSMHYIEPILHSVKKV